MLASSQQGSRHALVNEKASLTTSGADVPSAPKRDHDLVERSAVLLSFRTRTYMVVDLIHFSVLWRIYLILSFDFSFTRLVQPGVLAGVTGVWDSFLIPRFPFGDSVFSRRLVFCINAFSLEPCCQFKQYGRERWRTVRLGRYGNMFKP